MTMKANENMVLRALAKRHEQRDIFFTHVKNGPTQSANKGQLAILDGVAIARSWSSPIIKGFEVKVSRSDFLRDDKWPKYLEMCNQLSFVAPAGVVEPSELADGIGLIIYNAEKDTLSTKRKAAYREIPFPTDMLWYLIIARIDPERHPFFSSKREFFEEWVKDRQASRDLGRHVSRGLRELIESTEQARSEFQGMKDRVSSLSETLKRVNDILRPYGVHFGEWGIGDQQLRELLERGSMPNLDRVAKRVQDVAKDLNEMAALLQKHREKATV